jgi:hypothetical protein
MLRAMRGTFLFAFDPADAFQNEDRTDDRPTPEEIKAFLDDAVTIDVNTEENGNPIGFASAELDFNRWSNSPPMKSTASIVKEREGNNSSPSPHSSNTP